MKFEFERSFEKDFKKVKSKKLAQDILAIIDNVDNAETITNIKNIKKLKGFQNAYRIRTGNYRIGVVIESDTIYFTAFDHRKDIYMRFPK